MGKGVPGHKNIVHLQNGPHAQPLIFYWQVHHRHVQLAVQHFLHQLHRGAVCHLQLHARVQRAERAEKRKQKFLGNGVCRAQTQGAGFQVLHAGKLLFARLQHGKRRRGVAV